MVHIIDASVAIKWFVKETGHKTALDVLTQLLECPQKFAVPELFYFELVHVFNRFIPSPHPNQSTVLNQILDLPVARFAMTPELSALIREYQGLGLSGYDAAYVALAKSLKGRWLTFDNKAHARIAHLHLSLLFKEGVTYPPTLPPPNS